MDIESASSWTPRRLAKAAASIAALALVRPVRDAWRTLTRSHPVRVFTYHRVTDACRDGMTISPRVFERQIAYIVRHHRVVSLDDALRLLQERARLRRPVAVITFDDGYRSVVEAAEPILRAHGVTQAACFLSTALVGTDRRFDHDRDHPDRDLFPVMSWEEARRLQQTGWTLGGHTRNHVRLSECGAERLEAELGGALDDLRQMLAIDAPAMAYPYGARTDINETALAAVRKAGYRVCLSNYGGENRFPVDPLRIRRIDLGGVRDPLAWKTMAQGVDLSRWRALWPFNPAR